MNNVPPEKVAHFKPPFKKPRNFSALNVSGKEITESSVVPQLIRLQKLSKGRRNCEASMTGPSKPMSLVTLNSTQQPESEEDVSERELCCICKNWSPLLKSSSSKIVNWAQYDGILSTSYPCNYWVDSGSCVPALRLTDRKGKFFCPY